MEIQSSFDLVFPGCQECGVPLSISSQKFCCKKHQNTYNARKRRTDYARAYQRKNKYGMPKENAR